MLIDERALSQAEHTPAIRGSGHAGDLRQQPTAGTNGDITSTVLPGDIVVTSFSGQEVRHSDGCPLQRMASHRTSRPRPLGRLGPRARGLERAMELARTRH